jgi:hypothetical protein
LNLKPFKLAQVSLPLGNVEEPNHEEDEEAHEFGSGRAALFSGVLAFVENSTAGLFELSIWELAE